MPAYKRLLSVALIAILLTAVFSFISTPCPVLAEDTWTAMTSGTGNNLNGVWGTSCRDVFAVGASGTILHYNGSTWSAMVSGTTNDLYSVWGSSAGNVYAVGYSGIILRYNGAAWSTVTTGDGYDLMGIWGTSAGDVFAVGGNSTIKHYNGTAWSNMPHASSEITLNAVWGSAGNNVFAVGSNLTILKYDGGSWSDMSLQGGANLFGVWGSSANNVFAVGNSNVILKYEGSTWNTATFPMMITHKSIWGISGSNAFNAGYIFAGAGIIENYDGTSWSPQSIPGVNGLNGVWGSGSNDVFVVGNGGVILHLGNGCPPNVTSATINTTLGSVNLNIDAGSISNAEWVPTANIRCSNPSGFYFPYGMFSFNIGNLTPGQTVRISLRFPNPLPLGIKYYKCINGNMVDCTSLMTRVNEYTLVLALTDGGTGDADGIINGSITDPGGPAVAMSTPQSSSPSMPTTAQKPMSLSNISVKSASLSATKVAPGDPVTVTANVANNGTGNGTSNIKVYVNGSEESSQGVTVNSGGTTSISFTVSRNEPGAYTVYVGGAQAGSFTVDEFSSPNTVLIISGALVFFAFITGIIYIVRRRA